MHAQAPPQVNIIIIIINVVVVVVIAIIICLYRFFNFLMHYTKKIVALFTVPIITAHCASL